MPQLLLSDVRVQYSVARCVGKGQNEFYCGVSVCTYPTAGVLSLAIPSAMESERAITPTTRPDNTSCVSCSQHMHCAVWLLLHS